MHAHTHMRVCAHAHAHAHTHTYAHTHTHTTHTHRVHTITGFIGGQDLYKQLQYGGSRGIKVRQPCSQFANHQNKYQGHILY